MTRGLNKRLCDVGLKNLWMSGSGARPCEATGGKPTTANSNFSGEVASSRRTGARFETEEGYHLAGKLPFSFVPALHSKPGLNFFLSLPYPFFLIDLHLLSSTAPSRHLLGRTAYPQTTSIFSQIHQNGRRGMFTTDSSAPRLALVPLLCRSCARLGGKKSPPRIWPSITFAHHHDDNPAMASTEPHCARFRQFLHRVSSLQYEKLN
ncbi:hypothetical protein QBC36DRAFT_820 [Triangularia setosa]|uniref:Uncharacterized protein n=1 Tax=Triangularia setosa TaxID=2587417 RepID=A0AAN6WH95_9PEZI|nr:hypothetical protein QBC36DRAFT_820 [Podospora setosa]